MKEKNLEYCLNSLLAYGLDYVGVINAQGRIVEHASKLLHLTPQKLEMLCMGIRLQHSMQSDFDEDLGGVNYIVTQRGNLKFVSMPVSSNVMLAIAKKDVDHSPLIQRMHSKQFADELKNHLDMYNIVAIGAKAP